MSLCQTVLGSSAIRVRRRVLQHVVVAGAGTVVDDEKIAGRVDDHALLGCVQAGDRRDRRARIVERIDADRAVFVGNEEQVRGQRAGSDRSRRAGAWTHRAAGRNAGCSRRRQRRLLAQADTANVPATAKTGR